MWNIKVRRATEDDYGLVAKNGKVLEFANEEEARNWGKENIEGKSMWIVSWFVFNNDISSTHIPV
jgi:hypothetical protein